MAAVKRSRLSIDQKVALVRYVQAGKSHGEAAAKFGISRSAVVKIMKMESQIVEAYEVTPNTKRRKNVGYDGKSTIIDKALHDWQVRVENDAPTLNVTGDIIRTKALEFRDMMLHIHGDRLSSEVKLNLQNFKASKGWLNGYMQRSGGSSRKKCGEHRSVDMASIEDRLQQIQLLLTGVPLNCIWNIDEMALQHRTTSSRSYVTINHDGRGTKRCKDRITVTLIVNAAGEMLPMQVISKAKCPRVLKGTNIDEHFNIQYEGQKNAWQDGSTMLRLLHRINRAARTKTLNFYILLDNCSSHLYAAKILDPNGSQNECFRYGNLVLVFLPPCSTSECQPLDQGIIRSFKAGYRKAMLRTLLIQYDLWQLGRDPQSTTKFPLHDYTHMKNVLIWMQEAYHNICKSVIQRCFVKSNVLPMLANCEANMNVCRISHNSEVEDKQLDELSTMLTNIQLEDVLASSLGLVGEMETVCNELLDFDGSEATGSSEINDNEILTEVLTSTGCITIDVEVESESDDEELVETVSHKRALEALKDLLIYSHSCLRPSSSAKYVEGTNLNEFLENYQLHVLQDLGSDDRKLIQPKITSFFELVAKKPNCSSML